MALALFLPVSERPWGHDGGIHAANVRLLAQAIQDGDWIPRWLPEVNGGRGGPNFRYYAFFAYYPSALLSIAGLPATQALGLAGRLFFLVGFLGSACLARRIFGRGAAAAAPVVFCLSPYSLVLLQARLALPEYAALNVAPWAFLALGRWAQGGRPRDGILLGLLVALLLCLHTLAAVLWIPFLILAGAIRSARGLRGAAAGVGGILAGVVVAAFQCAPSALELGWIDASRQVGDIASFSTWALPAEALLSNRPEQGFSARLVPGPVVLAVLSLSCLTVLGRRVRRMPWTGADQDTLRWLLLAFLAVALSTQAGVCLSRAIRPISYIQFPWRFLGPLSLFAGLLASGLAARLTTPLKISASILLFAVGWGLVLPRYGVPVPTEFPPEGEREIRSWVYSGDFENKYLPLGARLAERAADEPILVPEGVRCVSVSERRRELRARLVATKPARVLVRRYWFPGVRVDVDGTRVVPERDPLDGEIVVSVPAGSHDLRVRLGVRALDPLYALVSAGAVLGLVCGAFRPARRLLAWVPCLAAIALTCSVGVLSPEGFAPPASLRSLLAADSIVPARPPGGGWTVVRHAASSEGVQLEGGRRGFAAALNLAPGSAIRDGMAVWAARAAVPDRMEAAFQHAGSVVLMVNGKRLFPPPYGTAAGGVRDDGAPFPIPRESLQSHGDGPPRVVVAASRIEDGARARIVVRRRGSGDRWRLLPTRWLCPDERNDGYRELFDPAAIGRGE